ncbi:helix-turn-helix domain-containing protein [Raoultibacter phocaeensis]|uniref:helix-turn-helix domain-containing protein n=1 Tax=Raoultibacter phocaeensis TaxID=2479841 RepID=UPI00111B9A22|nr:helix-turn-helix transcriptional regulator [Raoultibacter phocaeensis]
MEKDKFVQASSDTKIDIGHRLRARRTQEGLSIRKLSLMSGVSRTILNEIELGRSNATVDTLIKLSNALGIEPYMLFTDKRFPEDASSNAPRT